MPGHPLDFEPPRRSSYDALRQRCDAEYKLRRDDELTAREAAAIADELDVRMALVDETVTKEGY